MKKITSLSKVGVILCLLYSTFLFAQVGTAWVSRYNGPGNGIDEAYAIAVDDSGNVYVTGWSKSTGTSTDYDYATIKYNPDGDSLWVRTYNGPENGTDQAYAIAVDNAGYVYVTGRSTGEETDYDYATIKYNPAGVEQWVQRYNGPEDDRDQANAITVDGTGNVYVTGYSWGSGTNYDYATIKYNPDGVQQWVQRYNYNGPEDGYDQAQAIVVDGTGNIYVTGKSTYSWGSLTNYDYATIKYNPDGDSLWVQRYNGPANGDDKAAAIAVDNSGNVYVTGKSKGTNDDYATIKYNPDGDSLWVRTYNGPGNGDDYANAIAVDNSGNVYITGYSKGTNDDYATIKYNPDGVEQWVQRYNGPGNGIDQAYAIAVDNSGNVYVTGYSMGASYDYATIKYSSDGSEQWVQRYNGPGNGYDYGHAIAVDGLGNIYVTGMSFGSGTNYDYATIKYRPIPVFSVTPTSIDFGDVYVDSIKTDSVMVTNTGAATLDITSVVSDNAEFTVTPTTGNLEPAQSMEFYITFTPINPGDETGNIVFTHNAASAPNTITVTGNGTVPTPAFSVTPTSIDFGDVYVDSIKTDSVMVTNTGAATLDITSVVSDNAEFTVTPTTGNLEPAQSMEFYITFTPINHGDETGNIVFTHNAMTSPDTVTVTGTGVELGIEETGGGIPAFYALSQSPNPFKTMTSIHYQLPQSNRLEMGSNLNI